MDFNSPPDEGLLRALALQNLPEGRVLDVGFGTARNLAAAAERFPGLALGLELNLLALELAEQRRADGLLKAEVRLQNALEVSFEERSLAIAIVSIAISLPKGVFEEFLQRVWNALKPRGILHLDFATLSDGYRDTDFFIYTCGQFPEKGREGSYHHYCGSDTCQMEHPGVYGASFWNPEEADQLLKSMGPGRKIFGKTREWTQKITGPTGDFEDMLRSFYYLTWQKS